MNEAESGLSKEDLVEIRLVVEETFFQADKNDPVAQLLLVAHMDVARILSEMLATHPDNTITRINLLKYLKIALDALSKKIATQVATLSHLEKLATH